jgi:hypothetical protein
MEIKAREAGREAMFGPGGSAQGRSVVVSPDDWSSPNHVLTPAEQEAKRLQDLVSGYKGVSKVPQAEIDAAKAAAQQAVKDGKLSQADYDFLVWRTNEISPMSQQKIGQDYVTQGTNPYSQASWSIAKEANAKAARQNELYAQNGLKFQTPDWQTPGYEARQKARDDAAAAAAAKAAATPSPFTAGPGPVVGPTSSVTLPGPVTSPGPVTPPVQTPGPVVVHPPAPYVPPGPTTSTAPPVVAAPSQQGYPVDVTKLAGYNTSWTPAPNPWSNIFTPVTQKYNVNPYNVTPPTGTSPTGKATGGIATLASKGYPRRTGQVEGPGTEKSDSIPAMLSDGEFVMTAKAVRAAGSGDRRAGAKKMYALMHQLEKNASRG